MRSKRPTLDMLAATCVALGINGNDLTEAEQDIIPATPTDLIGDVDEIASQIMSGQDPLGDAFCSIISAEDRRPKGQTYTPEVIVESMLEWAKGQPVPSRIVDPGVGSGRYIVSALRTYPDARGVATDIDPYATLMTRTNALVVGVLDRLDVILGDYRSLQLPKIDGVTLFIGNPPYVRHHNIDPEWKTWLVDEAKKLGLKASKLAGLHAHFFLATALYAHPGDIGTFITSSEWLDVNYGKLIRDLLLEKLTLTSLHIIDPETAVFAGTTVTGTIACFTVGKNRKNVKIQNVSDLGELGKLNEGFTLSRVRLSESTRWSVLTRTAPEVPEGFIELGELARVHRGAVTGANKTWVVEKGKSALPAEVLYPSVTRAIELFTAGPELKMNDLHRDVIDLPANLDVLDDESREVVERFLSEARRNGVDKGYIARTRPRWWRVGLKDPAPILATYMARRPPTFVRNMVAARHINIAHGVYPREEMSDAELDNLAEYLRSNVALANGRTYAGGLTKFEPREMERLVVPSLELLRDGSWNESGLSTEVVG